MTAEEKRKEFSLMRALLTDECGIYCVNCGSSERIEYHHIVPLADGGNNVFSNIVPLCVECHRMAHGVKSKQGYYGGWKTGRPRKPAPEGYEEILDRYLRCEIKMREAMVLFGLGGSTKLYDQWFYRDYLKSRNIVKVDRRCGKHVVLDNKVYYGDGHFEVYANGKLVRVGAYKKVS